MSSGECQTKNRNDHDENAEKPIKALDEGEYSTVCVLFEQHVNELL